MSTSFEGQAGKIQLLYIVAVVPSRHMYSQSTCFLSCFPWSDRREKGISVRENWSD